MQIPLLGKGTVPERRVLVIDPGIACYGREAIADAALSGDFRLPDYQVIQYITP
ncbi:hypothetical protein [Candidatus Contendibacter odensensis]|uniref:Uncharacterized protein n=1 Tax=Candidatus Contendobacter odensis Run_B_J11 TaxID=1400861 RepID=A0A7U7GDW0_9GAMM|nr:hypothetical protein [Candidatus Contendobacter odensis]CDH46348.1 hypothetical protein BN874_420061 [Candidatus Contendobacter odensis Run_B_J11]